MFTKNKLINQLRDKNNKLEDKLKAVMKFVEKGPLPDINAGEDYQRSIDDWLGKLMNILEAEA